MRLWGTLPALAGLIDVISAYTSVSSNFSISVGTVYCGDSQFTDAYLDYEIGYFSVLGRDTYTISNGKLIDVSQKGPNNYVYTESESSSSGYGSGSLNLGGASSTNGSTWGIYNGSLTLNGSPSFYLIDVSHAACIVSTSKSGFGRPVSLTVKP